MKNSTVLTTLNSTSEAIEIGPFSEKLQPLITETLNDAKKNKSRKGTILTPVLLVWFVLAMTLRRDLDYNKTLNWLISGLRWMHVELPAKLVACGTISHARVKLGFEVFRSLFCKFIGSLRSCETDFHGFVSLIFDGSALTMPDTKSNEDEFGKPKTGRGKAAFPQMRIMALMVRATRIIIDIAYAPFQGKGTGERALMMQILERTKGCNFLFMFDAGFYAFFLIYTLQRQGQHFLMKISSSIVLHPVKGGSLPDGSYLALVNGKILDPDASTSKKNVYKHIQILVRVIQFQIPGFRPVRLITNIMDPNITAHELVCHYHKRWDIEIGYDEIKTHQCATLRGQCPTFFRSKLADLVKQELYAMLIVYNHTRFLICQAAQVYNQNPLETSFLDTTQWIIDAVEHMIVVSEDRRRVMFDYLLLLIAESPIDRPRRNRVNPRVVKVKMSKFALKRAKHKSQERDLEKEIEIVPVRQSEIGVESAI